ncbi:MAG: hypothetical protein QOD08_2076, partial [Gaiellaceae bacterium]|nr:hypothetical protein [Gaiellaceae bacterium]
EDLERLLRAPPVRGGERCVPGSDDDLRRPTVEPLPKVVRRVLMRHSDADRGADERKRDAEVAETLPPTRRGEERTHPRSFCPSGTVG